MTRALPLLALLAACGQEIPSPGDGFLACADDSHALYQQAGELLVVPCRDGCSGRICNFNDARPGDICPTVWEGQSECEGDAWWVRCDGMHWIKNTCAVGTTCTFNVDGPVFCE